MKSIFLVFIWMIFFPIVMGYGLISLNDFTVKLINKYKNRSETIEHNKIVIKDNRNILFAWMIGLLVEWTTFQILSVPFAYYHMTFTYLKNIWSYCIYSMVILSIILIINNIKSIIIDNINGLKEIPIVISILALISIGLQCYFAFYYTFYDADDSNFAAKATIAVDTDSLFVYDDLGNEYQGFPKRQFFTISSLWRSYSIFM